AVRHHDHRLPGHARRRLQIPAAALGNRGLQQPSAGTSPNAWSPTGEKVIDVPSKLSAQVRVFATGQGRKTDPIDAHSVAVAALRAKGLRQVVVDDETVALRLLVDRRDELGRARTDLLNRIHKLLLELLPGGAKTFLRADQ